MQLITNHILVSGKVQGVYFRQTTKEKATELSLSGSVENLANGQVEIYVSGSTSDIQKFLKWCANGSEQAKVEKIQVKEIQFKEYNNFKIV